MWFQGPDHIIVKQNYRWVSFLNLYLITFFISAPRNIVIDQQLLQKYAKDMFIVNWQIAFSNQGWW